MKIDIVKPHEIEDKSFEIISSIIEDQYPDVIIDPEHESIVKRVIHTSADFEYLNNLVISPGAVKKARQALQNGAIIVTDTNMAKSGINKTHLARLGGQVHCYIADEDVALEASQRGVTRAIVSMEKAAKLDRPLIFAIGNAPTALIALDEMIKQGKIKPELIIGVPVGFVNVVESKELIMESGIEYIVARGRKGGSNVAAAICNALVYSLVER
ncbi:precorrin-8X methylmutase [Proteocatella sphenisci]|uniref:precorrin-8X methylmutase n=1 Tax=Proteocatella sphenisci TaxID=181070 RepID=UPI0004B7C8D6|nr:precorrin-8X methylmutase [Proteocatella sphenisci]